MIRSYLGHENQMAADDSAKSGKACVMAAISRDNRSPSGWSLRHIDEYPDLAGISDWATYLKKYL